jgi:hypothetical protein
MRRGVEDDFIVGYLFKKEGFSLNLKLDTNIRCKMV